MKLFEASSSSQRARRDSRLTAVNFVADAINRTLDLREIAENAIHAMTAVTHLDAGAVYIWDEDERALKLYAFRGISEAFARQAARLRKGSDRDLDAVLEGETRVVEDFKLVNDRFEDDVRAGFRAAVLCAIRTQGFVVGMLALGTYKPHTFEPEDIDLIEVVSNQLGNAMVHAQLEADLRISEEQYRSLVENSDDAIYIAGPDVRPRYGNSACERILKYRPEELAALDPYERIHPDDVEAVRAAVGKLMDGQPVHDLEYRFCRKDGEWIVLQCNASIFARDGNQAEEFQFVAREITENRRRQQQLVRRNGQLAALTTLAAVVNSSLKIEEIARNTLQVALESTGMEAGVVHLADADRGRLKLYVQVGLPAALVAALGDMAWGEGIAGSVAATGEVKVFLDRADLSEDFQSLIVVPVKARGNVHGTLGLYSRREIALGPETVEMLTAMGNQFGIALTNAQLLADLSRKNELLELLIEEAHHRIKNNLQMVSGLLQLESSNSPTLTTAITRIQAIAKVHNLLSRDMPDLVDAQPLIAAIMDMLAAATAQRPEFRLEVQHVWLTPDQAVALALVVNELASNAVLHGKPPAGQALRVDVQCRQEGEAVTVLLQDNGGGLPADYDWQKSPRQGMSIIRQLAHINLRGRFDIRTANGGLRAEITFQAAPRT